MAFVDSFHVFNKPPKSEKLATTLCAHVGMYLVSVLINFLYDCYFYVGYVCNHVQKGKKHLV